MSPCGFHVAYRASCDNIRIGRLGACRLPVRIYCATAYARRSPPEELRELDCEQLLYDNPKQGPGGSGQQILTPLESRSVTP